MKKNCPLLAIFVLVFILSVCVTREYTQPEFSSVAETYRNTESGTTSDLNLLYVQDNVLTSAIGLVKYYLQNTNAKIELSRSLGGGWK